ncbi:DUF4870 domain-containing protein [Paenibacillus ginsengihumi]|uniref:DUF4870 domain-containing protein n=1 Tax=Paenibacillus ginsengihumi TaxID=431596 RepID=UPI000365AC50|nr:DUF4870 domain-containing protein [Paenibacillus ginsengihumi]
MDTNRLLAALCYFSIFFAGFIVPIAVFIVSNDPYVRRHAKAAFITHSLPFALLFVTILAFWQSQANIEQLIVLLLLPGIAYVAVMIYNVAMGIRVLIR